MLFRTLLSRPAGGSSSVGAGAGAGLDDRGVGNGTPCVTLVIVDLAVAMGIDDRAEVEDELVKPALPVVGTSYSEVSRR